LGKLLLLLKLKVVRWLPLLKEHSQEAVAEVTKQLTAKDSVATPVDF
jgi:hypothetical protein